MVEYWLKALFDLRIVRIKEVIFVTYKVTKWVIYPPSSTSGS